MTETHYYKHVLTGIVSEITDRAAAVFGDRLVRVESDEPESTTPEPTKPKKKAEEVESPTKEES